MPVPGFTRRIGNMPICVPHSFWSLTTATPSYFWPFCTLLNVSVPSVAKDQCESIHVVCGLLRQVRQWHLDRLWTMTAQLNVLDEQNWTAMADNLLGNLTREVFLATTNKGYDGSSDDSSAPRWTFAGALLYSVTVITTIGTGNHYTTYSTCVVVSIVIVYKCPRRTIQYRRRLVCHRPVTLMKTDDTSIKYAHGFGICDSYCRYCTIWLISLPEKGSKPLGFSHKKSAEKLLCPKQKIWRI